MSDKITYLDIVIAKKFLDAPVNERVMHIVLSSDEVIANWDNISKDENNNRQDIETPYEYIHEARKGKVRAGGYLVVISDSLPEFT